jgi:hypothetical protein
LPERDGMMKRRLYYLTFFMLCTTLQSYGVVTNWTGYGSGLFGGTNVNDWYNASNWSNGVPGSADDAQIGVSGAYTNSPVLGTSTSVKSLTFGLNSSGSLTINSGITLTVTNDVTVKYASNSSATISILGQTVSGVLGGTLTCGGSFYVGDNTPPITPAFLGTLNTTYVATVNLAIQNFNVAGSLLLNTTSASATVFAAGYSSNVNNSTLNLNNGNLRVTQNVDLTNSAYVNTVLSGYSTATNRAQLLINPATNAVSGSSSVFSFGGAGGITTGGFIDLYGGGAGNSTVNYIGTSAQVVYPTATGLDTSPSTYQNIGFSGSGVKTMQAGNMTIGGNWASAGGKIDASLSSIYFQGGAQSLTDASTGVTFGNVFFQGTLTKTLASGKFSIANTGILTMAGTATLAAGGNLTLVSNATGSATVAPLPLNTAITGNVKVQRFFKGSSTDLSKRGYRLISSAVYTAAPSGVKSYDPIYLLDSAYVSGPSGGGFNVVSNPSLYIYREDISPNTNSFTSGNFKGINKINNTNAYDIGTQKRLTLTNVADTTVNLPVGNGVLFFFRGNKTDNATQSGNKYTLPFDYPEDVTFAQLGQLNTGTVNVKQWYGSTSLSFTNSPGLTNSAVRGYTLVGNPYASTINWEKFNRNSTNSSIYGGGFPAASVTQTKIWVYNPASKQYETYMPAPTVASSTDTISTINPTGSLHTGNASNMIASGQGFFIRTTTTGQTLSFRETAKTTTQPASASIIRLMNAPSSIAALSFSGAPVANPAPAPVAAMLRFKLLKDSVNTDDVVLALNDKTDSKFSSTDDAEDLNGNAPLVSLSILSSDDVAAAIKQVKLPESTQQTISLLVDATTTGTYKLRLDELNNLPPAYEVWLKDDFTNDSLDIKTNNTYDFTINKANAGTFGRYRFKIIIRQNPALAMHALGFNAAKTTWGTKVSWKTENEADNYIFCVEKSIDGGKTFNQLGQLRSNSQGNYDFMDANPIKGKNLYRVKLQNTLLNNNSYSAVASVLYADSVTATVANNIAVYPNPTVNEVNIKVTSNTINNESYNISISNSYGRVIKQVTSNQPILRENVAGLLPGTYMVEVINTKENKLEGRTKFVKL